MITICRLSFRLFRAAFAICCIVGSHPAYAQQRYNTCEVFQYADTDSSYLERIAIKEFSGGHLAKEYSVAGLEHSDSYSISKRLKGEKIFEGGGSAKLKEIRRFYFVTTEYRYSKAGVLQYSLRSDDMEGMQSHENSIYQYRPDGKLARRYDLSVSHDLIHGVDAAYYTYDANGRVTIDSSVSDHRLVLGYQWNDDKNSLVRFDEASMNVVPVSPTDDLRFRFHDDNDTMNRTIKIKNYRYFSGGYEVRSATHYYFTGPQQGANDSFFTSKNGSPVRCIRRYQSKLQFVKSFYYNSNNDLARIVIDSYEEGNHGSIIRIYKYSMQKTGTRKK